MTVLSWNARAKAARKKIVLGFLVGQKHENETDVLVTVLSFEGKPRRAATDGQGIGTIHLDAGVRQRHALADVTGQALSRSTSSLSTFALRGGRQERVKGLNQFGVGGLEVLAGEVDNPIGGNVTVYAHGSAQKTISGNFPPGKLSLVDYFSHSSAPLFSS